MAPGQRPARGPLRRADHADHRVQRASQPLGPLAGREQVEVPPRAGALPPLDGADQVHHQGRQRAGEVAEDRGHLGAAVQDRQVPVDPGVRLRRGPVERRQPVQRAGQVAGVEPVQWHRGHRCLRDHLAGQFGQQRPVGRLGEHLGDRQVADRGGGKHRAVGQLRPRVADDVPGGHGAGDVGRERAGTGGQPPIHLPDHERGPVAAQHDAGCGHVGAEVDHRLHDPLRPDGGGQDRGGQAVLQADREPAAVHPARQEFGGGRRMVRLDRHKHRAVEPVRQITGCHRGQRHGEVLHRPGDPQPARADRLDDGGIGVAGQHVMTVPHQSGGHGAAHRAAAKHHVAHGG